MQALIQLMRDVFPSIPAAIEPYLATAVLLIAAFVLVVFAAIYAGVFIFFERRIAGRIMSRVGPNRVGPHGLLQFIADAVKLMIKEDIIPEAADRPLFRLAPYLVFMGVVAGFVVIPVSPHIIAADLNIGLLYVLAITSIAVVGVLMSGWASNSKWALFGGMRSAAQIVSYEIPNGLALLPAVLLSGTMSTQGIILAQGGAPNAPFYLAGGVPWNWYLFHSPMTMALFVVYMLAALAEGARIPFDLPEGESELVSGYNTEYSGFRFGAYFTAEFAHTWIAAGLAVIVFLGGWQVPFVQASTILNSQGWSMVGFEILAMTMFMAKMVAVIFIIIQLRWTLPRVRVDQMMVICWKYLLPITFVAVFLVLGWMLVLPWESPVAIAIRILMVVSALAVLGHYIKRVHYAILAAHDQAWMSFKVLPKFWI